MAERRRTPATYATAFLSLLLLLGGIGLVWLGCMAFSFLRPWGVLAIVDAMLLLLGSLASLVYLAVRLPAAWTGAVVFLLVSIAPSSRLAFEGTALAVPTVAVPVILAAFSLAAFFCLVSMHPQPQYDMPEGPWPLADYIRTLFVLASLLLAGVGLLWLGWTRLYAIVDAMFLLIGSVASLVYLVARVPAARTGALVSLLISVAWSSLLVVLVIASFPEIRRHGGEFAGLQTLAAMASCVALVVLALLTLWASFCVISIRPSGNTLSR